MNIFKRMFSNSSKTIDPVRENTEKTKVELKCIGTYSFDVVGNPETEEEFYEKLEPYMKMSLYYPHYYTHHIIASFKAKVGYNGINYDIENNFTIDMDSENKAYIYLYKLLQEGENMDEFNRMLQHNIAKGLDKQLQENNIDLIKQYLEENEPLAFDFTFKTDKTNNIK